jgi:hypothetical protein
MIQGHLKEAIVIIGCQMVSQTLKQLDRLIHQT